MPRARCGALSEANSSDVAIKMSGALTTNSHSNELKCMLMERILEKTAQHGFISMSRATERSAHRRRQGAIFSWAAQQGSAHEPSGRCVPCHRSPHAWRAAERKHTFFAGVRKRTGHMSMHDQSATLTVAFSLLAASRCLEEQQTDGARGDPPAGGRGSCTIRACCARLGACAPLSDPPRLRVSKIRTLMGARLPLAGALRRRR